MTAQEFINFWQNKKDHDSSPAIGIGIHWDKIAQDSKVIQYTGEGAWIKIGDFFPPLWGNFKRTLLKEWLDPTRPDYNKFIEEEKSVEKVQLYDQKGLIYPDFSAFADESGLKGILADGSHRYIDINYLIINGKKFDQEIEKCRLDVICLENLHEVLSTIDFEVIK